MGREKITRDQYKLAENEKNLTLLIDNIPSRSDIKVDWRCNVCNYIQRISYCGLMLNKTKKSSCSNCSGSRRKTEQDFIALGIETGMHYLGPFPNNTHNKTYWRCLCGKTVYKAYLCIFNRKSCMKCGANKRLGENNGNFNPSKDASRKQHDTTLYYHWTKKILEKFNFTCQKCNVVGGKLCGHHIFNWSEYNNLRYDINNGICLCQKCHLSKYPTGFHKIYKSRNNTLQQIEEFIGRELTEINRDELLNKVKESLI